MITGSITRSLPAALGWLLAATLTAGSAPAQPATASSARATLETLVQPDLVQPDPEAPRARPRVTLPGHASSVRANRALRLLERLAPGPEGRETARWALERYADGRLGRDYYGPTCQAIILLWEATQPTGEFSTAERAALQKAVQAEARGCLPSLARIALAADAVRRRPPLGQQAAYETAFREDSEGPWAFLVLHHFQLPSGLEDWWSTTQRYSNGRLPWERSALRHYFGFRAKKFPSVQAEMEFLWGRILDTYAKQADRKLQPPDWAWIEFSEARGATARLIEIGEPVVPFLLARSDFILSAAHPQDARSVRGDNYELWVMRTLLDPRFQPLLRRLAVCGSPKVERPAQEALRRMELDDPNPFRMAYVLKAGPPNGG